MPDLGEAMKKAGLGPPEDQCPQCGRPKKPRFPLCERCARTGKKSEAAFAWPEGYPKYFDERGVLREEYVTDLADQIAQEFGRKRLTMHQLREFFRYVRQREGAWRKGRGYDEIRVQIKKLKAFAAERSEKGKIPAVFREFLDRNVDKVDDNPKSFLDGFVEHFQAVVAYSAGRVSDREGQR
jgi:CRISPR type III-A-associated protein Csm2